jgi:phage gp36-like protein
MGRYISYNEVLTRYPLTGTWSEKESHVNSQLIYYAENELDSMLAPSYSTPFSAAHPTVVDLSLDLCKYKILLDQDAEKAESIYNIIEKRVEKLLSGEMQIITGSGSIEPTAPGAEIWSNTKDYEPTHTMLDEDSYYTRVDSSLQSDLENERL